MWENNKEQNVGVVDKRVSELANDENWGVGWTKLNALVEVGALRDHPPNEWWTLSRLSWPTRRAVLAVVVQFLIHRSTLRSDYRESTCLTRALHLAFFSSSGGCKESYVNAVRIQEQNV